MAPHKYLGWAWDEKDGGPWLVPRRGHHQRPMTRLELLRIPTKTEIEAIAPLLWCGKRPDGTMRECFWRWWDDPADTWNSPDSLLDDTEERRCPACGGSAIVMFEDWDRPPPHGTGTGYVTNKEPCSFCDHTGEAPGQLMITPLSLK